MGQLFFGLAILLVLNENWKFRIGFLLTQSLVLQLRQFKEHFAMLKNDRLDSIIEFKTDRNEINMQISFHANLIVNSFHTTVT